ncbi:MAG: c-type cytochrome [Alphaproteobacteria bacterium]|nr:c-type cytochrome [Alphaproteobacteria bacterium]
MRRRRRSRRSGVGWVLLAAAAIAAAWVVWRPSIRTEAVSRGVPFEAELVQRGAELAAIGNCNACHTREGGPAYAGGRPIATPFGTVFSTNITPDAETGIGGWTPAAFTRAMREGVSRDGRHLYPAFPYDHMTRMRQPDIDAVYAFIMTRQPVVATPPDNDLTFPFNLRGLIAFWKLLFLERAAAPANAQQNAEWNRGAYLVEGLGHCGACHTPRNALGAEKRDRAYAGGETEGWVAPALNAESPAAVPWDAERLYRYLRHGFDDRHGLAAGPMAPVVRNLASVPDGDVRAISVYVAAMAGQPNAARSQAASQALARASGANAAPRGTTSTVAASLYAGACAQCHGESGRAPSNPALHLALSSSLRLPVPDNAVRIVRDGVHSPDLGGEPLMPGFANALSDAQLAALLAHLRTAFTEQPAWGDINQSIRRVREHDASALRARQKASQP